MNLRARFPPSRLALSGICTLLSTDDNNQWDRKIANVRQVVARPEFVALFGTHEPSFLADAIIFDKIQGVTKFLAGGIVFLLDTPWADEHTLTADSMQTVLPEVGHVLQGVEDNTPTFFLGFRLDAESETI